MFKIIHGYNPEDYIEIKKEEVEKAFYCFLEKKDSVFSGGAIKGSNILMIKPDFHKAMGWNRGYKMDEYDYAEIREKGLDRKMENFLQGKKEKVQYLMQSGRIDQIGKNVEVTELEKTNNPFSEEIKRLSDNFKVS